MVICYRCRQTQRNIANSYDNLLIYLSGEKLPETDFWKLSGVWNIKSNIHSSCLSLVINCKPEVWRVRNTPLMAYQVQATTCSFRVSFCDWTRSRHTLLLASQWVTIVPCHTCSTGGTCSLLLKTLLSWWRNMFRTLLRNMSSASVEEIYWDIA